MATTREHRAEVVRAVREGYARTRSLAARAGVTQADEDAAGPPAVVFATVARKMREAAGTLMSQGPRAMRRDAAALDMLAALCEGESLTWAEVRS